MLMARSGDSFTGTKYKEGDNWKPGEDKEDTCVYQKFVTTYSLPLFKAIRDPSKMGLGVLLLTYPLHQRLHQVSYHRSLC